MGVIKVRIVYAHGARRVYPANTLAEQLTDLLEQRSFTERNIAQLKRIGFTFVVAAEEL